MPTIKDVALAAGVSHATVSNVLNKKGNVSSEKIRLVKEAARSIGYQIDEQASLLRRGVTKNIAVILPDIKKRKYSDLYVGLLNELEKKQYSVRLFLTGNIAHKEKSAINSAIAAKCCAILAVSCLENVKKHYGIPILKDKPILFLIRNPKDSSFPCLTFDFVKSARILSELAKKSACCKPIIFTGDSIYSNHADFIKGVKDVYKNISDRQINELKYGELSTDTYRAFELNPDYDSIICSDPEIAEELCYIYQNSSNISPTIPAAKPIYVMTPLRTSKDPRFTSLDLNYSKLGIEAGLALIENVEQNKSLNSKTFSSSDISPTHISRPRLDMRPLRMLSLKSPTDKALRCLLPEFTNQTGIPVEIDSYPLTDIYKQLTLKNIADFDILRLDVAAFDYMAHDFLTPLSEIDPNAQAHLANLLPGLANNYSYIDDILYAFPFDVSIQMLFYRKDLFEDSIQSRRFYELNRRQLKVPENFDEYNEIARFFSRKYRTDSPTLYGTSVFFNNPSSTAAEFLLRFLSIDGISYDEDGFINFSSDSAFKALDNYLESTFYSDPVNADSWETISENFAKGQSAMTMLFINHASGIMQNPAFVASSKIGFAPVPGARPLLGGGTLGVSIASKRKYEAYRFIKWASGKEIAGRLMQMGGISACKSAYEYTEIINKYPWLENFEVNLKCGNRTAILSRPGIHLNIHDFEVRLGRIIIDAYSGKTPLNESVWRVKNLIEEIKKEYNKYI